MSTTNAISSSIIFPIPSFELILQVSRQVQEAQVVPCPDRREDVRNLMVVPVLVQTVNESFEPLAPPFGAVTRDISPQGIGLVHTVPIDCEFLALRLILGDEDVNLVAKVHWCEQEGPAFYYIGCKFIAKLAELPLFSSEDSGTSKNPQKSAAIASLPVPRTFRPHAEKFIAGPLPSTCR
jgi:hypothetical protein